MNVEKIKFEKIVKKIKAKRKEFSDYFDKCIEEKKQKVKKRKK